MSDCRFGVSPVNYPDPDPDPDTCPGAKHPVVAKRADGTGFYLEVTNNDLFNMDVPSSVLST